MKRHPLYAHFLCTKKNKNLYRIMRISTFLLFLCVFQLLAVNGNSQNATIQLPSTQLSLGQFFDQIEKQTDYLVVFSNGEVNVDEMIRVSSTSKRVSDYLEEAFHDKQMNVEFENNYIILSKNSIKQAAQQTGRQIRGVVTDERGEPVIGANVIEKGTVNGVITDIDGNFSLNVSENAVLHISYIGYISQTIMVGNQELFQIILKEDYQSLEEVVVVGYGTQKKVNLTGAVSSIKFGQELENRPITNASQALAGKISGVWVSQNSGKPGDDGAQLRIRGWGTLNNSAPLVIIDGVEGGFDQINPNDIENISVLKDAASAAIYGSKAANGVVLVTTKMGGRNEKTQVNFSAYTGIQSLGRRYDLITNSAEVMSIGNQAYINEGKNPIYPDHLVQAFRNGTDKYKYPNTDWFDTMFEPSMMYEANLSVKGGTEKSSSYLSVNYLNQDGMLPNSQSYRYGIRANMEYDINSWFKVGGRFNYIRKVSDEPYDLARVFESLRETTPFISPYTRDGRFGSSEAINDEGIILYDNRNPMINASNGSRSTTADFMAANIFAQATITHDLNVKITWSSTGNWNAYDKYNEPLFGYTDSGIETMTKNYNREGLEMIREQKSSMNNNLYATLNYDKTFGYMHNLSAVAGLQTEDYQLKSVRSRRTDPPKAGLSEVDAGTSGIQGNGNMVGLRMFSYFGRVNYAFAQKYLFEANFRADASSRFKKENRWGYFPGFSAGWRLNEENFIKNLDLFSNLKLRVSWGQLGNQYASNSDGEMFWPYLTVINQSNELSYSYDGNFAPGAAVTAMVDEDITWETTSTLDVGLDIGLLNNKLNMEIDYFYKKTSDIIVQLPIPLILGGVKAPYENVGEMLNKGVEFTINYGNNVMDKDRLGFDAGFNVTYVDNEVTKFRGGESPDQLYLIREGYSYKTLYGYKVTGIYQTDEEALEHMYANGFKPKAGYLKFEDVNQDGKLGYEDKQELGRTIPKIMYGLNTNLRYKNFDLNLLFQGIGGANLYTQSEYTILDYERQTVTKKWRDAWTAENPHTKIPGLKFNSTWDNSENSFWVHRADFLKLKNIQLGYMVPHNILSKWNLSKLYLYANAQNVFTLMMHKGYEGFDPERASDGNGQGLYPSARIISFGLNLTF